MLKEHDPNIVKLLKRAIMVDYLWKFRSKIIVQKKKVLEHFKMRSDFQSMYLLDNTSRESTETLIKKMCGPQQHTQIDIDKLQNELLLKKCEKGIKWCKKYSKGHMDTVDKLLEIIRIQSREINELRANKLDEQLNTSSDFAPSLFCGSPRK